MKTLAIWITIILAAFILNSCRENSPKRINNGFNSEAYKNTLQEKRLGDSKYYISIPKDYKIEITNGEDFSVYYFRPTDTTRKTEIAGGIYFGNNPTEFPTNQDSCTTQKIKNKIMGENADWDLLNCKGKYAIQTLVKSNSGEGWNELVHAFGNANSATDLKKILSVFTTMKKKK